ncbi:MAG: HPr(Ser) kinase/phosphatase, partial [Tissierellia bacterium]|nr:HPr(Ser) kinase/phosphatase [Tissierellia bacterium]
LAPEITLHGVLIEVYGMGVLIVGKSGVGKSETALDLVIRGHRLVSDDLVDVKKVEEGLRGEAPELTRHFMEIRGIGILDIERLYGVSAVKHFEYIDLVVELETWDAGKEYDRIGLDEDYMEILDMKVTKVTVPVRPGRNIGMIVEVAVRNYRQKGLGYNAAEELNNRIMAKIEDRKKESDK